MVHLRILVPSYQSEHALDLLDGSESVCNLVFLERVARRPEGDVILCDVAREDASVIVADLRELDIDLEGSISIEEIDSQISGCLARSCATRLPFPTPLGPVIKVRRPGTASSMAGNSLGLQSRSQH